VTTAGPYGWVRHPMYSAFLLILSAPGLIAANWFIGLSWIAMTAADVLSRIRAEEAMMLAKFGDRYAIYSRQTGRLLPPFFGAKHERRGRNNA
jgi:protein-S-isoprenylcysteine O-methyltransferase Ste14